VSTYLSISFHLALLENSVRERGAVCVDQRSPRFKGGKLVGSLFRFYLAELGKVAPRSGDDDVLTSFDPTKQIVEVRTGLLKRNACFHSCFVWLEERLSL